MKHGKRETPPQTNIIEAHAIALKTVNCTESEHLLYSLNSFY